LGFSGLGAGTVLNSVSGYFCASTTCALMPSLLNIVVTGI